jgi:hypothetical protein
VVVKSKRRSKYSRKNNPAVELMKRVVEAKRRTDLENHDFYSYDKYQKITLAVNDVTPSELEAVQAKKQQWMVDQVEMCPLNNKLILPLSVDETVSKHIYRKDPKSAKDIITGQRSKGVNQLIETGNILNTMLKDAFTDVAIYADQIRMLRRYFTSPIGKDAIDFYRFYIEDTLDVGMDRCISLSFKCPDAFSQALVLGLAFLITTQAFLHILVNVRLIPITGHTLPLISHGGTAYLVLSAAVGIILSVSRSVSRLEEEKRLAEEAAAAEASGAEAAPAPGESAQQEQDTVELTVEDSDKPF